MEEWELRLSLVEAEDWAGQQDEDFPGTKQMEAQKQKEQSPPLQGKPSILKHYSWFTYSQKGPPDQQGHQYLETC